MSLLIIPDALRILIAVVGILSLAGLSLLAYILFVRPVLVARAENDHPPPRAGFSFEIIIDRSSRSRRVSAGQVDSDINTRLNGIREDHLVLEFEKERELEEYEISVIPGGPLLYRQPHAKKLEFIKSAETLDSRELIGDSAVFRLATEVKDSRALQYVEFILQSSFFINQYGEEKMRFTLLLNNIFPSLDLNSRDKNGVYSFGKVRTESSDEEAEEENEEESQE